jgi:hypothetical protein
MSDLTEKALEKAQSLWENGLVSITPLPEPDQFGSVKLQYQELRRLIKQRTLLSYSDGICYGIAACQIDEKRRKKK